MSKYQPLADFLKAQDADEVPLTFAQIERLLGARLPASAYDYAAWWANDDGKSHVQAKAWLEAGFTTERVSAAQKRVVFRKIRSRKGVMEAPQKFDAGPTQSKLGRHPAIGALKGTFTIAPGWDVVKPAFDAEELEEIDTNLERTARLIEQGLAHKAE